MPVVSMPRKTCASSPWTCPRRGRARCCWGWAPRHLRLGPHYYFEGRNGNFIVREPLIPGHEASAVVAGVGDGVTRVKVGDKVAVSPSHACGRCEYCREGREHLCSQMRFLGSASRFPHVQGMFQEYFVMGERQCYPVEGDITLGELAFAEPLAVGLHGVNRGGDLLGKSVLVTARARSGA